MNKGKTAIFDKQLGQAIADGRINDSIDAAFWGANWMQNDCAAEIARLRLEKAELLNLLTEIHTTSPAGSQFNPWIDTRVKLRKTLEKYGLI